MPNIEDRHGRVQLEGEKIMCGHLKSQYMTEYMLILDYINKKIELIIKIKNQNKDQWTDTEYMTDDKIEDTRQSLSLVLNVRVLTPQQSVQD